MKKYIFLIFFFFSISVVLWSDVQLTVSEKAYLIEHKVLIYAIDRAGQPFEFVDESGELRGFCIDYARDIADILGINLTLKPMGWNDVVKSIENKTADMADMYYSKKRARFAYFTSSFLKIEVRLIVKKDNSTIFGIKDLKNAKIGTLKGDFSNEYLKDKLKNPHILSYDTPSNIVKALDTGEINVMVGDYPTMLYFTQNLHMRDKFKTVGSPLYTGNLCFATHSLILRDILNKAVKEFERYPARKDTLIKKWFGEAILEAEKKMKRFRMTVFILLITVATIAVLFVVQFVWNRILEKRVTEKTKEIGQANKNLNLMNEELRSSMEEIEDSNRQLEYYYSILYTLLGLSEALFFSPDIEGTVENVLKETSDKIEKLDGIMILEKGKENKMELRFVSNRHIPIPDTYFDIQKSAIPEDILITYPGKHHITNPLFAFISKVIGASPRILVYDPIYINENLKALNVLYFLKADSLEPIELDVVKFISTQLKAGYKMYYQMKELKEMVEHDTLTGLYNRKVFEGICQREIARTLRYGGTGVFVILDLNDFKEVNDIYGHLFGDQVLIEVAKILKTKVRDVDVISRYGGDEIAILFTGITYDQGIIKMDMMNSQLQRESYDIYKEKGISISFSYGLSEFPTEDIDYDELFRKADIRLYEMKKKWHRAQEEDKD